MRVRFLKGIASIYGTFEPGKEIDVPNEKVAASWLRNGIAEAVESEKPVVPETIPDGQYWCSKCEKLHREASKTGQKHLKYNA